MRIFRFFTASLSLIGLFVSIGAFLTGVIGVRSSLMSLSELALPVTLFFSLVLFIYWLIMKSGWVIVSGLSLLLCIPILGSVIRLTNKTNETLTVHPFSLCSYNSQGFTYGDSRLTLHLFAEFVQKNNIQILCLQEMDERLLPMADSLFDKVGHLDYHKTISGSKPGFGLAVYSSFPVVRAFNFRFAETSNHAIVADIVVQNDTVRVFNLHLQTTNYNQSKFELKGKNWVWDTQGEAHKVLTLFQRLKHNSLHRMRQAEAIGALVDASPYPVIVCGDLNSTPASYAYWRFKQSLEDGFRSAGHGYEYTYRYFGNAFRIDYIFHQSNLNAISYKSFDLDYSDHKPVVITLSRTQKR